MNNSLTTMQSTGRQIFAVFAIVALFFTSIPLAFAATAITSVTLDPSAPVNPGQSISVTVSVSGIANAGGNHWKSTEYRFGGGSYVCVNTGTEYKNPDGGTANDVFVVAAPLTGGDYNFEVRIYHAENCGGSGPSASKTLTGTDGVSVLSPGPTTGTLTIQKVFGDNTEEWVFSDFGFSVNGGDDVQFNEDGENTLVIDAGTEYLIVEVATNDTVFLEDFEIEYSDGCSGSMTAGAEISCVITNTIIISDGDELVDTLIVTNPAVDGDTVSGLVDFTAEYVDHDEVLDTILWAIRFETCAANTGTVAGNVDGFTDSSVFGTTTFVATLDTTTWADGEYCFVVNPQEQDEEPDLRAQRLFTVDNTDPEVVVLCEDDAANNYSEEGDCTYDESYLIYGYVWNDENGNGDLVSEPEEGESGIGGRTVTISNGEEGDGYLEFSIESDETGYYEFYVPAGTWIISDGETEDTEQTYPINEGNVHVVTVPQVFVKADTSSESLLATVVNWLIPTAHADYSQTDEYGPYNFGNKESEGDGDGEGTGSGQVSRNNSSGTRVGGRAGLSLAPSGLVLGASTSAAQCGVLIYDYLLMGQDLDSWEVMKLQYFLTGQGFYTPATGVFDTVTDANVRLFQVKYSTDILAPWNITEPTGYVYKTTLWKLNNMVCPGSQAMPSLI